MENLERIDLFFENGEQLTFSSDDVAVLCFDEKKRFFRTPEADNFVLGLSKEAAQRQYKIFGVSEWTENLETRLRTGTIAPVRDIVCFDLTFNNNKVKTYTVYWEGDDDYDNPAQNQYWKGNVLMIEIGKKVVDGAKICDG